MAEDQRQVMARLGFERFAVVGHDRGGRVAYRLALDHPGRVTRLAVLDMVPTVETWARMDRRLGLETYHWMFLAQPADLPERLIGADPDYFLRWTLDSWAGRPDAFDLRALAEYHRAFRDPGVIHATCEDYRAGATIDVEDDAADRDHRRIACPVLTLWAEDKGAEPGWDSVAVWRDWARDVRGQPVPSGHFLPEETPAETLAALEPFLAR
jgi:haloacetate dehalogenase